jgi:hypothetical protein
VKAASKTCYVLFKEQPKEIIDQLLKNTDANMIYFINTTNAKYDNIENLVNIDNNPATLKNTLDRLLKENQIDTVILDDFVDVQKIQDFELPLFVQNISDIIKTSEARGYFIVNEDKIDNNLAKDISLIVDKIE